MALCRVCNENEATLPEGGGESRYCARCWDRRLRQLFHEEDRFHIQRILRGLDAEKYLLYHQDHQRGTEAVGVIFAMLDRMPDHLEISSFLSDKIDWHSSVPFIYEQGVECEVELIDILLGVIESELVTSWRCSSWAAEVTLCTGEPFWIDSQDLEKSAEEEPGWEEGER